MEHSHLISTIILMNALAALSINRANKILKVEFSELADFFCVIFKTNSSR